MNVRVPLSAPHKTALHIALFVLVAAFACGLLAGCQSAPSAPEVTSSPATSIPEVSDTASSAPAESSAQPAPEPVAEVAVKAYTSGDEEIDAAIAERLSNMSTEEKVAQLFVASAESLCSDGSTLSYVDDDVISNLTEHPVAGICLLGPNLEDEEQTRNLLSGLQETAHEINGLDLLLCVDEEGGEVSRIGANANFPLEDQGPVRALGDAGDTAAAKDAASRIGTYLFDIGFNVDFAPVADVDTEEAETMDSRSFGTDSNLVAEMVSAQVTGFSEAGVLSCAKHFPGIGAAVGDSHTESITVDADHEQLLAHDAVPFVAAIEAGVPMVMVGHVSCPQLTGDNIPATFSRAVMTGLLRNELGFSGVIVTDALNMSAATQVYGSDAALRAFEAGADLLLLPEDFEAAYESVLAAVEDGSISAERLDDSVSRILGMKLLYAKQTADLRAEAQRKAEEEAAKAAEEEKKQEEENAAEEDEQAQDESEEQEQVQTQAATPAASPNISIAEDYRASFVHGDKTGNQKYIMLHDTEGDADAYATINYWDSAGTGTAAHFIVNKDGSIVQCVPMDSIAHHAGFGDAGHNAAYGVEDESRDDRVGTTPIGDWAPDYGMNSYSIGIEMVHVGGSGYYPEEQLAALDSLIAYIDSYYGYQSTIIDHKAWRSGNSDTSPEFAQYLANYQDHRTHN